MNIRISILIISALSLSCSKDKSIPDPEKLDNVTADIAITVNVNEVVRPLTGNEVGININYLMDDAVITGNTYSRTAEGIKQMGAKILRYPGGEKSDNYLFSSSPYTSAAPKAAFCTFPASDTRFYNSDMSAKSIVLDFDEFMLVCNRAQAIPLIVVPYDAIYSPWTCGPKPTKAQLIEHAKEWVRYANITRNHNIKLWMIGNESFLESSYNGFTTPALYALDIVEFADAMRSVDPTIKIIANGKSNWWSVLLNSPARSKIDYLAVSNYLSSTISSYDNFRTSTQSLNLETDQAISAIENIPDATDRNRINVIESEFNSIDFSGGWASGNDLGHALANFKMLGDALLKPKVFNACLWNTHWIENNQQHLYDALNTSGGLNATGLSLSVFGNNLLSSMVRTSGGSNIVNSYASFNADTKTLNVFLLNKELFPKKVTISFANYLSAFSYDKWEFKGSGAQDKSPVWGKVSSNQTGGLSLELTLPANSVTMLSCK
jgi:hypothetical protein